MFLDIDTSGRIMPITAHESHEIRQRKFPVRRHSPETQARLRQHSMRTVAGRMVMILNILVRRRRSTQPVTYPESGMPSGTTPRESWILAIDTSTEQAGLALGDATGLYEQSWAAGRTQTTSVLPEIDTLLHEAGIPITDLGAIAIASGPGTFTGLRVGMSIAKGLVLARDLQIFGIPTLDIAAAGAEDESDVVAVLPAGRGRVVWQRYGKRGDQEPRNMTVPEFVEHLADVPEVLVIGELPAEHRATIEQAHSRTRWENRRPAILLKQARERWLRGEVDDPVTLEPSYLHGMTVIAGPVSDRLRREER